MTKEDYYYHAHIEPHIDDSLKLFVEKVQNDGSFKQENHSEPWNNIIPKLMKILRCIIYEEFKANAEFNDFFKFGLNINNQNIESLICSIESILVNKFPKSPPFTIYRFVNILFFLDSKISIDYLPLVEKDMVGVNVKLGLQKYNRIVNDLVMDTKLQFEVINRYHKSNRKKPKKYNNLDADIENDTENDADNEINDETIDNNQSNKNDNKTKLGTNNKFFENDVKAVKYLKSLMNVISVESSISDVDNELLNYGSKNMLINNTSSTITNNNNTSYKDDDTVSDSSVDSLKMVKIPWYDPSMLSQGNNNSIITTTNL